VQPDSLVPGAANPQMFNRYAYTNNNPINFSDPSGHGVDCGINQGCISSNPRKLLTDTSSFSISISVIPQGNHTDTCGESAITAVCNYIDPENKETLEDVKNKAVDAGYYVPGFGTTPENMTNIVKTITGIDPDTGNVSEKDQALEFLFWELKKGNPIIVDLSVHIGYPNTTSPGENYQDAHFVVISGWNSDDHCFEVTDSFGYRDINHTYLPGKYNVPWNLVWESWTANSDKDEVVSGAGWYMILKHRENE
jgi:hypothetical protein